MDSREVKETNKVSNKETSKEDRGDGIRDLDNRVSLDNNRGNLDSRDSLASNKVNLDRLDSNRVSLDSNRGNLDSSKGNLGIIRSIGINSGRDHGLLSRLLCLSLLC